MDYLVLPKNNWTKLSKLNTIRKINKNNFIILIHFLRKHLRDGLKVANTQDLNGLTALTLIFLGNVFYISGGEGSIKVKI